MCSGISSYEFGSPNSSQGSTLPFDWLFSEIWFVFFISLALITNIRLAIFDDSFTAEGMIESVHLGVATEKGEV